MEQSKCLQISHLFMSASAFTISLSILIFLLVSKGPSNKTSEYKEGVPEHKRVGEYHEPPPPLVRALLYMHRKGIRRNRVVLWSALADSDYCLKESPISCGYNTGILTIRKTTKVSVIVKLNYEINCAKTSPRGSDHVACLVRDSPTIGRCHGVQCCLKPLDSSAIKFTCRGSVPKITGSFVLMSNPRLNANDSLYVVTNLSQSNLKSGSISVVKI